MENNENLSENLSDVFSIPEGATIAKHFVDYLAEYEPLHNLDECMNAVHIELCQLINNKYNGSVSALYQAELFAKFQEAKKTARYNIVLNVGELV